MERYYHILGLETDASREEIRAAYLKEAKHWHPDVSHENPEEAKLRFRELNEAYHELTEDRSIAQRETLERYLDYLEALRKIRKWKASDRYRERRTRRKPPIQFGNFVSRRRR